MTKDLLNTHSFYQQDQVSVKRVNVFQPLLLPSSGKKLQAHVLKTKKKKKKLQAHGQTHSQSSDFIQGIEGKLSLSFIATENTRLIHKPNCYKQRIYTLQDILFLSRESSLFFQGRAVNLDTSLSKNNSQKPWSFNLSYFPCRGKKKKSHQMVVADISSSPHEIFLRVFHKHSSLCTKKIIHAHKITKYFKSQLNNFVDELPCTLNSCQVLNSTLKESFGTTQQDGLEISLVQVILGTLSQKASDALAIVKTAT